MNGRNRPMQYRRPLRRRRARFPVILVIVGGVLLVLLTVLLIIGGRMHKKSQAFRETLPEEQTEVETPTTPETPSILAYPLASDSLSASLDELKQNGASAASVALNNKSGESLCSAATLSSLSARAKDQEIYLSGVFYLDALVETDDLARFARLSESCATLAEALRAGLSEVVLVVPASPSAEHVEELVRMVDDLRTLVPDAVIGLSLPHGFLTEANAETVDTLSQSFSLLATDLSQETDVSAAVDADLYYLLRYSMRVLLPFGQDNEAQISAVKEHGVENIQILP